VGPKPLGDGGGIGWVGAILAISGLLLETPCEMAAGQAELGLLWLDELGQGRGEFTRRLVFESSASECFVSGKGKRFSRAPSINSMRIREARLRTS
jgi:hypothetical protein